MLSRYNRLCDEVSERFIIAKIASMVCRPTVVRALCSTNVYHVVSVSVVTVTGAAAATLATNTSV